MIVVQNLSYSYDKKTALDDISLSLESPGIAAVLGPNGAGKSTLLYLLAGLLPAGPGCVKIDGRDRKEDNLAIREFTAYVPDSPELIPSLSGREFLEFICECYDVPETEARERIERLGRVFHLTEVLDDSPTRYSRGQAKKLSLCAAFVSGAKLYLLDEPFSGGLDPDSQHALTVVLQSLVPDGALVVYATQIPEIAEEIANRIVVLHEGRVRCTGALGDLESEYEVAGQGLSAVFARMSGRTREEIERLLAGAEENVENT